MSLVAFTIINRPWPVDCVSFRCVNHERYFQKSKPRDSKVNWEFFPKAAGRWAWGPVWAWEFAVHEMKGIAGGAKRGQGLVEKGLPPILVYFKD